MPDIDIDRGHVWEMKNYEEERKIEAGKIQNSKKHKDDFRKKFDVEVERLIKAGKTKEAEAFKQAVQENLEKLWEKTITEIKELPEKRHINITTFEWPDIKCDININLDFDKAAPIIELDCRW